MLVDSFGGTHLLQLAIAHDSDPICHRQSFRLVVGDVDRRGIEVAQEVLQLGPHFRTKARVDVRDWLVHDQNRGVPDNCPGNRHALFLAAG